MSFFCLKLIINSKKEDRIPPIGGIDMKEKFLRFMQGRYGGADKLNMHLMGLLFILVLIEILTGWKVLMVISLILMVLIYFRMFSKNIYKRYQENQKYTTLIAPITKRVQFFKRKRKDKTHKYYKCPTCKQIVRVPKGHGKIEISCPKCHAKFVKRT